MDTTGNGPGGPQTIFCNCAINFVGLCAQHIYLHLFMNEISSSLSSVMPEAQGERCAAVVDGCVCKHTRREGFLLPTGFGIPRGWQLGLLTSCVTMSSHLSHRPQPPLSRLLCAHRSVSRSRSPRSKSRSRSPGRGKESTRRGRSPGDRTQAGGKDRARGSRSRSRGGGGGDGAGREEEKAAAREAAREAKAQAAAEREAARVAAEAAKQAEETARCVDVATDTPVRCVPIGKVCACVS